MDLRMECRQKCQGDSWQRMSTADKENGGGPAGLRLAAPHHSFSAVVILCLSPPPLFWATHESVASFILATVSPNHHPPFFFLVGWVGAVPHPLPGVPLTFLSAFHTEIQRKSLLLSNANANENANANAKASRHLFWQQYLPTTIHLFFFLLGGWVLCLILCQGSP